MVYRVHRNDCYTTISNHSLRDIGLSLKAKGLMAVVMSLPEDWIYSVGGLASLCKEKEGTVSSVLKELQTRGYLKVSKQMPNETNSGRIEYVYDFYEEPIEQAEKSEPREQKHKHGEYQHVLLTDSELQRLKELFPDYQERIRTLDEYLENHRDKRYSNHCLTIQNWARRDKKKQQRDYGEEGLQSW